MKKKLVLFFLPLVCAQLVSAATRGGLAPVDLRCEYREDPLGIDVARPRLSWRIADPSASNPQPSAPGITPGSSIAADQPPAIVVKPGQPRGVRQTAYRILVASSPELLRHDEGDLWDSGKVASDQSTQVEYAGQPLRSGMQCYWQVQVWTTNLKPETGNRKPEAGARKRDIEDPKAGIRNRIAVEEHASASSAPTFWTMGLLQPDDWKAAWIGYDAACHPGAEAAEDDRRFNIQGLQWVRMPGGQGRPGVTTCFRKRLELPADRPVKRAVLALYAYHYCEAAVNGRVIGTAAHWEQTARLDAAPALRPGANVVTLRASHTDPYLPAVIGRLVVQFASGADLVVPVDKSWKASQAPAAGCERSDFDDAAWAVPDTCGPPWGGPPPVADLARVPAPYLRKEFTVAGRVRRATVYVTALGTYELHLNGQRVGQDVLTPGWTEFRKRVHYQTYDVTPLLRQGANALGAILGDGWYASDLAHLGRRNFYGGNPRLLAQLVIERADGTAQVVASDASWKAAYGPIRHADLIMGCEYDARREMPGWDRPGFDDHNWAPVVTGAAEEGADVTARLAAAVRDGKLSFKAENDALGGDPAFGKVKLLRVTWRAGGREETRAVGEHATLELAGADLRIVRAVYGPAPAGAPALQVQAAVADPARVINELPAVKVTEPRPGCWTFDLGQNMVGWVRLKVRGAAGQRLTVRHGEMVNPDGTIYTAALRSCPAADFFILKGGGEEVLEPYFTFHGFRYVEVRGLTEKPGLDAVTGRVVHTPLRRTGRFACSYPPLNQLYSNIIWGQKGNHLEVPTDCPQRDERMGWTGDTQFFAAAGAYNFDVAAFFTRWLLSCEDDQFPDGSLPHVVPDLMGAGGAMGWGDAGVLCIYNIFRTYGDTRVVAERYGMLERYMQWLAGRTRDGITHVGGFGDWLNAGGGASAEVIDTAYHATEARMMAEMAAAIGRAEDAQRYAARHAELKAAFQRAFLQPDGALKGSSQTGYALAFAMDLLPAEMRDKVAAKFVDEIRRFNWHLATGFIGTPRLLPALSLAGRDDVAYRLLLTDTYPSWLFPVKNGATTMWERWNGWTPDKGFGDIGMNSFNHYAFGAVAEYLYGGVGGIRAASPGYKTIIIRPALGEGLTWAAAAFDSLHGRIATRWQRDGARLTLQVVIPPNTTASIFVPATDADAVTESGRPAAQAPGLRFLRMEYNAAVFAAGSGGYEFGSTLPAP